MTSRTSILLSLILPTLLFLSSHEDVFRLEVAFGEGRNKHVVISAPAIRASPSWDPDLNREPVLSVGKATRVALDWLSEAIKREEYQCLKLVDTCEYKIIKVSLERFEDEKWMYEIQFEEANKNKIGWAGGEQLRVDVWVDMTGKVWVPSSLQQEPSSNRN